MMQVDRRGILLRHAALWVVFSAILLVLAIGVTLTLVSPAAGVALRFPPLVLAMLIQVVMLVSWGIVGLIPTRWPGRITPFRAIVALVATADLIVLALVVWGPLDSVSGIVAIGTPLVLLACVLRAAFDFIRAGELRA